MRYVCCTSAVPRTTSPCCSASAACDERKVVAAAPSAVGCYLRCVRARGRLLGASAASARSAAWCLRCERKVCVAVAFCAWLGLLLPPLRASARSDAWCLRSAASARSIWPFACAAREGPSVAKCPGWSLRDHCLGRYNLTGDAGRSRARHGRVRVGRACVVWSLLDIVYFQLIPISSNRSAVAVT